MCVRAVFCWWPQSVETLGNFQVTPCKVQFLIHPFPLLTVLGTRSASIRTHNYSDGSVLLVVGMETVQRFRNTTHQTDSWGPKHVELNDGLITRNLKLLPQPLFVSWAYRKCFGGNFFFFRNQGDGPASFHPVASYWCTALFKQRWKKLNRPGPLSKSLLGESPHVNMPPSSNKSW